MKIVYIGCVEFSHSVLLHMLHALPEAEVVGVVTRRASSFNADFHSLAELAAAFNLPCFFAEGNNQDDIVRWIRKLSPDVVYCFGWSYLLGRQLLDVSRLGVVGYHPAALPQNRGRHPIIWALALGLSETASTFFFMDDGADSGDILDQEHVSIEMSDDAKTLYSKLADVAIKQVAKFTKLLASNTYSRTPQNHLLANYWRKRSKNDGQIDWRMSATSINNLIRALTRPYPGAHCMFNGSEFKIWRAELACCEFPNIEPGKVIDVSGRAVSVKCGTDALRLMEHEFIDLPVKGSYL
jgi:methionyl-tRNA formyltransferase